MTRLPLTPDAAASRMPGRRTAASWALWAWVAGAAGAALMVLAAPPLGAAPRVVTFGALDGRALTGLLVEAAARPSAAVVLVPMLGRPKEDWQSVGERFADADITALAIDLPGASVPEDPAALARWHEDVRAAVAYLANQPSNVRPGAVGLLGASLGANLAVLAAAADPRVRSMALVSPSLDYRGVRIETALREYGARPALLLASLHDPYAARSVRQLALDAPGVRQVQWSDTPAHGTVLLSRDPGLVRSLVEWFQLTLG